MRQDDKQVRVVIDTNICISMLIGKRTALLRQVFASPQYELTISEALIDEILLVTHETDWQLPHHDCLGISTDEQLRKKNNVRAKRPVPRSAKKE